MNLSNKYLNAAAFTPVQRWHMTQTTSLMFGDMWGANNTKSSGVSWGRPYGPRCPAGASQRTTKRLCVFSNTWVCMLQHARGTDRPERKSWCATETSSEIFQPHTMSKLYIRIFVPSLCVKLKEPHDEQTACAFCETGNHIQDACVHKLSVPNLKDPRSPWWDHRGQSDTLFPTGAHEWRLTESHLRQTSLKPQRIWVSPRRSEVQQQQHWGFKFSVAEMRCALPRLRCLPSSSHHATVTRGPTLLLHFSALWLGFWRAAVCRGGSSPPGGLPLPCRVSKTQSSAVGTWNNSNDTE